jgi:hypothetical protein
VKDLLSASLRFFTAAKNEAVQKDEAFVVERVLCDEGSLLRPGMRPF